MTNPKPKKQTEQTPSGLTEEKKKISRRKNKTWSLDEVFKKCIETLGEDIQSLSPKDRISLWKDLKDLYAPKPSKTEQAPGFDIVNINWHIIDPKEDARS